MNKKALLIILIGLTASILVIVLNLRHSKTITTQHSSTATVNQQSKSPQIISTKPDPLDNAVNI